MIETIKYMEKSTTITNPLPYFPISLILGIFFILLIITFLLAFALKWKFVIIIAISIAITGITSLFLPGLVIDKIIAVVPSEFKKYIPNEWLSSLLATLLAFVVYTITISIGFIVAIILGFRRTRRFPWWKRLITGAMGLILTIPYASTIANPLLINHKDGKSLASFTEKGIKIITFGKGGSVAGLLTKDRFDLIEDLSNENKRNEIINEIINSDDLSNNKNFNTIKELIQDPNTSKIVTEVAINVTKDAIKKSEAKKEEIKKEIKKSKEKIIKELKTKNPTFETLPEKEKSEEIKKELTKNIEKTVDKFIKDNKNNKEVKKAVDFIKKINKEVDKNKTTEMVKGVAENIIGEIVPDEFINSIDLPALVNNFNNLIEKD